MRLLGLLLLAAVATAQEDYNFTYGTFSDDFIWATSTSSHQIEGGWDADGKGENIWDRFCHNGMIANNMTADIACDSYNKIADDVQILSDMQVGVYRFSIAWARVLPNGTLAGGVNEAGVAYYNNLIDSLLAVGIKPMVTLYHWDLPSALQDVYGGFENEALVPLFVDYAELCFQRFGDRVDLWLTFNEPWVVCWLGYGNGIFAPGIYNPGWACYRCTHTIIKAHAETWHLYNEVYRPIQGGRISISLDSDWKEPMDDQDVNIRAAERAMQFKLGWFANPIFNASGDYPEIMKTNVLYKSMAQGYNMSRLPVFTQPEIERIRGTYDFFGLNHYTTYNIEHFVHGVDCISYECDSDYVQTQDTENWPSTGSGWLYMVPWGMQKLVKWITDAYGPVPILVTENGCSDRNSSMQDTFRSNFYREYINALLRANQTDGVNMMGYTAWSLMDNFEWRSGYDEKFGLHYVDFDDPTRTRVPKQSARDYTQIILDNGFPEPSD